MTDWIAVVMLVLVVAKLYLGKKQTKQTITKSVIVVGGYTLVLAVLLVTPVLVPGDVLADDPPYWVSVVYLVGLFSTLSITSGVLLWHVIFKNLKITKRTDYYWPK